jgi:inosine-uridine nucleoside N-ribohydrolase
MVRFPCATALLLACVLMPPAAGAAGVAPIPVILDTDVGDDIDDTWAIVTLLKSPELDVRLITTDYGNTVYRAKIVARLLEIAGRTDVSIGIGIKGSDNEGPQAGWVKGYDLAKYPGRVIQDGVQALVDTAMASPNPMTLIAIGPCPNLKAALEREPRVAPRLRLAGMYGSLHVGYDGKPTPEPEWNVKADVPAARALLSAPWHGAILTPLDTCGRVQLKGERYARVRDSKEPLAQALIENYRLFCPTQEWCAKDSEFVSAKSSTLYDTVAVYLAFSRDLVTVEDVGVRVSDEGMILPEPKATRRLSWAVSWKNLDAFEELLANRLTAPVVRP